MAATDRQINSRGNIQGMLKEAIELLGLTRNAGLGFMRHAKFTYDFTVDGGAIGLITPRDSPVIPQGSIIVGGVIDVTAAVTSGGAATVGLGLGAGAQVASLFGPITVAGAPWSTTGVKALIPVWTAASSVKAAAATKLTLTVAAFVLTGGKFDVNVEYFPGNI